MRAVAVGSCSFQTIRSSTPKNMALQKASDHQAKTSSHNQANTISDHVHPFLRPAHVRLNELYAEPKQSRERKSPPQKSWSQDGGRQDQSGKGGHMRQLVDGKRIDLRQILGRERQPADRYPKSEGGRYSEGCDSSAIKAHSQDNRSVGKGRQLRSEANRGAAFFVLVRGKSRGRRYSLGQNDAMVLACMRLDDDCHWSRNQAAKSSALSLD